MKIVSPSSLRSIILNKLLPTIDSTFPSISHKRPRQILVLDKINNVDGIYFKKYKSIIIFNTKNFELTFFHEYIHFIQDLAGQRFDNSVEYNNRRHEIEARTLSKKILNSYESSLVGRP
jgi:Zn-dependent peptidase ImmA (M78 family)